MRGKQSFFHFLNGNTQFVLEVKAVSQDPTRTSQRGRYTGEKLSLNFQNVEVRAVLKAHVDQLGTDKLATMLAESRFVARLAGEVS